MFSRFVSNPPVSHEIYRQNPSLYRTERSKTNVTNQPVDRAFEEAVYSALPSGATPSNLRGLICFGDSSAYNYFNGLPSTISTFSYRLYSHDHATLSLSNLSAKAQERYVRRTKYLITSKGDSPPLQLLNIIPALCYNRVQNRKRFDHFFADNPSAADKDALTDTIAFLKSIHVTDLVLGFAHIAISLNEGSIDSYSKLRSLQTSRSNFLYQWQQAAMNNWSSTESNLDLLCQAAYDDNVCVAFIKKVHFELRQLKPILDFSLIPYNQDNIEQDILCLALPRKGNWTLKLNTYYDQNVYGKMATSFDSPVAFVLFSNGYCEPWDPDRDLGSLDVSVTYKEDRLLDETDTMIKAPPYDKDDRVNKAHRAISLITDEYDMFFPGYPLLDHFRQGNKVYNYVAFNANTLAYGLFLSLGPISEQFVLRDDDIQNDTAPSDQKLVHFGDFQKLRDQAYTFISTRGWPRIIKAIINEYQQEPKKLVEVIQRGICIDDTYVRLQFLEVPKLTFATIPKNEAKLAFPSMAIKGNDPNPKIRSPTDNVLKQFFEISDDQLKTLNQMMKGLLNLQTLQKNAETIFRVCDVLKIDDTDYKASIVSKIAPPSFVRQLVAGAQGIEADLNVLQLLSTLNVPPKLRMKLVINPELNPKLHIEFTTDSLLLEDLQRVEQFEKEITPRLQTAMQLAYKALEPIIY